MINYLRLFIKDVVKRPSLYFFVFLAVFTVDRHNRYETQFGEMGTFYSDVLEYYRYLPDYFIHGEEYSEPFIKVNRRTVGMAILYAPAFMVAHVFSAFTDAPRTGYSPVYDQAIRWGSIIYCFIGLLFARNSLRFFFNEWITLLTLIATFFATNLFYYTYSWGEFPHSYLFCLYSIFTYLTIRIVRQERTVLIPLSFFVAGFITLVRPSGVFVLLFPILFGITQRTDLLTRLKLFTRNRERFALAVLLFWLPLVLQMSIWKRYHGSFVTYSYGEQGFFFLDPQITNFLFSFRKGWLLYTPVMAFALIGILLSFKYLKEFALFNVIYLTATIYFFSCYWDWSSGGSFGCRFLVESYAFLVFPLALTFSKIWSLPKPLPLRALARVILLFCIVFFAKLNIIQLWQCKFKIMHWNGMTRESYRFLFMKENFTDEEIAHVWTLYKPLDDAAMLRGERDQ